MKNMNYRLKSLLVGGGELDLQKSCLTFPNRFAYDDTKPLYGTVELPAHSSLDFDVRFWMDSVGDFTLLPAFVQSDEICYGTASGVHVDYDDELKNMFDIGSEDDRGFVGSPKAGPYDSRGEIEINFHDYDDLWRLESGNIPQWCMNIPINKGRPFTFQYWFEDFDHFWQGRVPGQGGIRWQNNYYLTPNRQIPKMYQKGIVAPTLSNGYPVLSNSSTSPGTSLGYLFNGQNSAGVIAHYKNVTKLFNKHGNYYEFTDGKEALSLNPQTNEIIHRPGDDMFLPLPVISQLARNFWFGMDISLQFQIPDGHRVDGQDMVYNFYGDDDLWVFIDDVLVLDIGGIHPGLTGSINFTTGEVREGWIYSKEERQAHENSTLMTGTRVSTIAQKFKEAGRTWNNAVGTKHSMKVFYLERGNGGSRCGMNFRLPVVSKQKQTSITAEKVWSDNNSASRPTSVTVDLYQNNKVIANAVLNQANGWKHTWSNLVYEKDGQTFTYDVRERAVNGYTGSVQKTGSNESGWKYVFTNTLNMSYVKVQKASANPNITGQSVHYSLAGAEYTIYRDSGCKNKATYTGSLVTNEQGMTGTVAIAPGTYYVKETKPSKGFGLDPKVYTISVTGAHSSAAALVVNSTEPVRYGTGSLQKVSAKPDITNGNSVYSLEGAEYGVYADKTCKQLIHTLRTDANGNATWTNVPFGTYYVKETKPSKGFGLDTNIYSFVLTPDNATGAVRSTEPLATGTLSLSKVSALLDETTGNPNYSLAGAEYGVWKTKDCSGTPVHTMRTDDAGTAMLQNVLFGTYYVKETKPSLGFELDKEIHEITLDDGHVDVKVTSTEPLMTGRVRLIKVSDNPDMTDNNSCYSLADAEYGVWKTKECTGEPYRKVVTGEDGTFVLEQLPFGNYWVKEIKPSKGFDLDTNVYPVVLDGAHMEAVVNSVEPSQNDPMVISITKLHEGDETDTIPSLAGTQFTVWYYDNLNKDVSGTPKKTWVLEVQKNHANGLWSCSLRDKYLVKEKSDDFYRDPDTKKPVLPYGTYKIQETQHAPGYTFNGGFTNADGTVSLSAKDPYITVVDKNTTGGANLVGGNEYSATNKTVPMSITLKKFGDGKQPLAGVTFKIQSKSGYAETQPDFQSELTTGPDGTVKWSKLHPDIYTITEIKTVDGYSLLQDPIEVQLPSSFTKEQAQNSNLVDPNPDDDTDGVIWNELEQVYLVTDPVFEIDNHVTFVAPSTGGTFTWMMLFPLGLGLVGFGLLVGYVWKRKRV